MFCNGALVVAPGGRVLAEEVLPRDAVSVMEAYENKQHITSKHTNKANNTNIYTQ